MTDTFVAVTVAETDAIVTTEEEAIVSTVVNDRVIITGPMGPRGNMSVADDVELNLPLSDGEILVYRTSNSKWNAEALVIDGGTY